MRAKITHILTNQNWLYHLAMINLINVELCPLSHSELGVQLGTAVKIHFRPLRKNLRLQTRWLVAAQSTSHMVALQMGSWAPPVCVSVCFCLCVRLWVRQAFRISTSEDNVNESWLSLFLLLLFFHPEASSRNLKAAIRVTRRSTGIKDTKIVFVFLAESFGKLYNLMFNLNFTPLWSNKWQYNRSLVGTQTYEWTNQLERLQLQGYRVNP